MDLIGPSGKSEPIVMTPARVSEEDHSLEARGLCWDEVVAWRQTISLAPSLASASPEFLV